MLEKVKKLIAKQLQIDEEKITEQSSLLNDLGADSLEIVEMVMTLESEFGIEISDEQIQNLQTVGDIVKFLEGLQK